MTAALNTIEREKFLEQRCSWQIIVRLNNFEKLWTVISRAVLSWTLITRTYFSKSRYNENVIQVSLNSFIISFPWAMAPELGHLFPIRSPIEETFICLMLEQLFLVGELCEIRTTSFMDNVISALGWSKVILIDICMLLCVSSIVLLWESHIVEQRFPFMMRTFLRRFTKYKSGNLVRSHKNQFVFESNMQSGYSLICKVLHREFRLRIRSFSDERFLREKKVPCILLASSSRLVKTNQESILLLDRFSKQFDPV